MTTLYPKLNRLAEFYCQAVWFFRAKLEVWVGAGCDREK